MMPNRPSSVKRGCSPRPPPRSTSTACWRVKMAPGEASKATMVDAPRRRPAKRSRIRRARGPKIKFQHGPRRNRSGAKGLRSPLALPSQSLSHQADVPPGAAGDFAPPTAEDTALASAATHRPPASAPTASMSARARRCDAPGRRSRAPRTSSRRASRRGPKPRRKCHRGHGGIERRS